MDRFGLLPPDIRANVEREQAVERHLEMAKTLTRALKQEDHRLECVWVQERAPTMYGWVPGRWHIRRNNDSGPDSYMPITGPNGEYCEPYLEVIDELRRRDLWRNPHIEDERVARDEARREKDLENETDARKEEFRERAHNFDAPAVSMSGDWTARKYAKRDRKAVIEK